MDRKTGRKSGSCCSASSRWVSSRSRVAAFSRRTFTVWYWMKLKAADGSEESMGGAATGSRRSVTPNTAPSSSSSPHSCTGSYGQRAQGVTMLANKKLKTTQDLYCWSAVSGNGGANMVMTAHQPESPHQNDGDPSLNCDTDRHPVTGPRSHVRNHCL